jgi:hypothetical protein
MGFVLQLKQQTPGRGAVQCEHEDLQLVAPHCMMQRPSDVDDYKKYKQNMADGSCDYRAPMQLQGRRGPRGDTPGVCPVERLG